jgi:hypothetical protein
MIRFLHAHSSPAARIVGSAALIYGLRFDPRLRDDEYLGTRSRRAPDVIIVGPLYKDLYEHYWNKERPTVMRKIDTRLSAYNLVFRNGEYRVYFRPGDHNAHL